MWKKAQVRALSIGWGRSVVVSQISKKKGFSKGRYDYKRKERHIGRSPTRNSCCVHIDSRYLSKLYEIINCASS